MVKAVMQQHSPFTAAMCGSAEVFFQFVLTYLVNAVRMCLEAEALEQQQPIVSVFNLCRLRTRFRKPFSRAAMASPQSTCRLADK